MPLPTGRATCTFAATLVLFIALAPALAADELGVVVERTAHTGEAIPLLVRGNVKGKVRIVTSRIQDPKALIDAGVHLSQGGHLTWLGSGPDAQAMRKERPALAALYAQAQPLRAGTPREVQATIEGTLVSAVVDSPGLYLIEARGDGLVTRATALVSDLALITKRDPASLLVFAMNRRTGKPWPGVTVTSSQLPRGSGVTGADGVLVVAGGLPPTIDLRAEMDGHHAFGSERYFPTRVDDRRVHVLTHQPAYRPGETVELKGIVRRYDGRRYSLDSGTTQVTLRALDSRGNEAWKGSAPVSADLGTFAATMPVPADAPTGAWKLITGIGPDGDEYEAPLLIDAYRKPAFEVRVAPRAKQALWGEAVEFDISARYYDGGTLGGANAKWELYYNRVDRDLLPTDELVRLFFGTEREAYKPVLITQGTVKLDAAGKALVTAAAFAKPAFEDGYLSLRATVTGPDRMAVLGSGGLSMSAAPIRVALETDRQLYAPEDIAGVTIRLEQADGRPAAGRTGLLTLGRMRAGPATALRSEEWIKQQPFTTDERGNVRLEVPLNKQGQMRFSVAVARIETEPPGAPAHAHLDAWVAADRPTVGRAPSELDVICDRDHYRPGQEARFLVRAPGDQHAVLAALEGARLLRHEVVQGASIWRVKIDAKHAPNVFATFATIQGGELQRRTLVLRVPPTQVLLTANITPDAPALDPGASSGATVRITDARGAPVVGAELSLAIVDEALHALHADQAIPLPAFFHAPRPNDVSTGALLHHASYARTIRRAPAAKKLDGAVPPPGSAAPTSPAPSESAQPNADPAAPARRPRASAGLASGDDAAPEEEMEEEMEEILNDMGQPEDRSTGIGGGAGERFRLAMGKKRGNAGATALQTRRDFRSAVHWSPTLRTDAKGEVHVEDIKYADSLTRWRLQVHVVDAQTRVGSGRAQVVTRKEVAVSVTPPRFLRAHDIVSIPVVGRNLMKDALGFFFTFRATGTSLDEGDQRLHKHALAGAVPPGGRHVDHHELEARRPGGLTLKATVTSGEAADAEERSLAVLPRGIPKVAAAVFASQDGRGSTTLQIPKGAQPGSLRGYVRVEGSSVQAVLAALPYLADYPHGCTEQTLSRFVPLLDVQAALTALQAPANARLAELPQMIEAGLTRLTALQHRDGGFGWWPTDQSNPAMTALVMQSLSRLVALDPGQGAAAGMRDRSAAWLRRWWKDLRSKRGVADAALDANVLLALAMAKALPPKVIDDALSRSRPGFQAPITQALLLRAAVTSNAARQAEDIRARLLAAATTLGDETSWGVAAPRPGDAEPPPARWQDDPIEATAEVLHALVTAREQDKALLGRIVNWLVRQRVAGDRWRSTRDTAACVRALSAHAQYTGAAFEGQIVDVALGEQPLGSVTLDRQSMFGRNEPLELPHAALVPGTTISVQLSSRGAPVTASVVVRYVEEGAGIRAASNGLEITRRYWQLIPEKQNGRITYHREPLTETVESGALVECELVVKSSEARDYVMIRDPHVAGFEPLRAIGREVPGRQPATEAHQERYDDETLFFVTTLAPGQSVFRHLMRATHVGQYTALPAQAELMYFPDLRGNGNGHPLEVRAAAEGGAR